MLSRWISPVTVSVYFQRQRGFRRLRTRREGVPHNSSGSGWPEDRVRTRHTADAAGRRAPPSRVQALRGEDQRGSDEAHHCCQIQWGFLLACFFVHVVMTKNTQLQILFFVFLLSRFCCILCILVSSVFTFNKSFISFFLKRNQWTHSIVGSRSKSLRSRRSRVRICSWVMDILHVFQYLYLSIIFIVV